MLCNAASSFLRAAHSLSLSLFFALFHRVFPTGFICRKGMKRSPKRTTKQVTKIVTEQDSQGLQWKASENDAEFYIIRNINLLKGYYRGYSRIIFFVFHILWLLGSPKKNFVDNWQARSKIFFVQKGDGDQTSYKRHIAGMSSGQSHTIVYSVRPDTRNRRLYDIVIYTPAE